MSLTKEELEQKIAEQNLEIANIKAQAEAQVARLNSEVCTAIGRCQGKIELYEAERKSLSEVTEPA